MLVVHFYGGIMKKNVIAMLLITSAAMCEQVGMPYAESYITPVEAPLASYDAPNGFFYFQFFAGENDLSHSDRWHSLVPGIGVGYRRSAGNGGAADISITGIGRRESIGGTAFWTAPKISYLRYITPDSSSSLYLGAGMAWGGVHSARTNFLGLIPSATLGYEFAHNASVLGFSELSISQPVLDVQKQTSSLPSPMAQLSVGVGF
jgi:hypothetical protein